MTLVEVKALLAQCARSELRDLTFGDAEIYWTKDGKEVAFCYEGRTVPLVVSGGYEEGKATWEFRDGEARLLLSLGRPVRISRNDVPVVSKPGRVPLKLNLGSVLQKWLGKKV